MAGKTNRQWLLANRPAGEPGEGEFVARALYLSVDPYMRGRMRDVKSYATPAALGEVMVGGVVSQVIASKNEAFAEGDIVQGNFGWQEYAASDGAGVHTVDASLAPISTALGVLGMPGMTAYFGLLEVGQPVSGETVVVSAASGAVGGVVGQIAKIKGCRAVGIAGGTEKCAYVTDALGFDAAVDYKVEPDLRTALADACPEGIDVYFDNVGGVTLDTVLSLINLHARIAICGMISEYNLTAPELAPRPTRALLVNRARMQGLLVHDWADRRAEGIVQMATWIDEGKLQYREDVLEGIENMPKAFLRLLRGENFGKQLVKAGNPD
jgi:NADPH-dependent curcumin reductase CurA